MRFTHVGHELWSVCWTIKDSQKLRLWRLWVQDIGSDWNESPREWRAIYELKHDAMNEQVRKHNKCVFCWRQLWTGACLRRCHACMVWIILKVHRFELSCVRLRPTPDRVYNYHRRHQQLMGGLLFIGPTCIYMFWFCVAAFYYFVVRFRPVVFMQL